MNLLLIIKDYVLVHAGIDPENSLEDQEEDTLLWIRDYFFLSECDLKRHIFLDTHHFVLLIEIKVLMFGMMMNFIIR